MDGNSFYNTVSHFVLFLVVATHLKGVERLWRLLGAITASGVVVGLYAALQFYGLDPFGIHVGGGGVVSSLGNPIFTGAFLLMVAPMTLALALKSDGASGSPGRTILWVIPLTILMLGMAFTMARGPWVGLAAGLATFMVLLGFALGWRASLRGLSISAAAIAATWLIVTFVPASAGRTSLAPRALSVGSAVVSTLAAEFQEIESQAVVPRSPAPPSSMQTRFLLWKGAAAMALHRPWFQAEDRPPSLSLHLFGYGPELFQYVFPLVSPQELRHLSNGLIYYGAEEAHTDTLNRWVELGFFGLASRFIPLGALAFVGIRVILRKGNTTQVSQRLVMAAVLASVAGRTVEQLAGISHLSDEALFWTLLAVAAALPVMAHEKTEGEARPEMARSTFGTTRVAGSKVRAPVLQVSLAAVLAAVVLGFTMANNANYAIAENRATSASASLDDGRLAMAMQSIDDAIALAPDVGRYHVIQANILDQIRNSTAAVSDQARLALGAYQANGRAVNSNPFDIYGRLHFAESALTLSTLGHPGKDEEAIEGYRRLTFMQPRFWLSHFLLGRVLWRWESLTAPLRLIARPSGSIRGLHYFTTAGPRPT